MTAGDNIDSIQMVSARSVFGRLSSPWIFCFILIFVSSFFLSGTSAPGPSLDSSYQAVLEYAAIHNFQFGKDIVFTYGPLGFLNTTVSQGLLPFHRILFALIWSGLVAWSVTVFIQNISGTMKYVYLVWFLLYSNLGGLEQHAFIVMTYGSMILMGDVARRKCAAATILTLFAILSLIKFTFFMAATASVILCVFVQIGKRGFKSSFAVALFSCAVFTALWMASGQNLDSLIPWLKGSVEVAGGYTAAMTIFPNVKVLVICFIAGAVYFVSLLLLLRIVRLDLTGSGILLVTTAYLFLSWKSSFARADGHVMGFILFLPLAFGVLFFGAFQKRMKRKHQLFLATLYMGVVLLCNWAADFQEPGTMLTKLLDWPRRMSENSSQIFNVVTGNWNKCFQALQEDQQKKRVPDLHVTRAIVGKSSVDVINYTQYAALANNLNYRPRPVIQGYCAYTPYLQNLNLAFYRSEQRPQYLLYKMETIDNRFPTLDDAPLLTYIFGNYHVVARDGEFLILKSSRNIHRDDGYILTHEQTVAFGEQFDLSPYNDRALLMQVRIRTTVFGKLANLFFQSPVLYLNTVSNGKAASYRFIPAMAEQGFVINPLLHTNRDVMAFLDGELVKRADSISFSKPEYDFGQSADNIELKLYVKK